MAPLSNYISFLFLITLLFPLQIITARDSQFFSKVTSKETELLGNKEGPPVTNKPEQQQQPEFIPETENSYGLYGHDSHDHLPSTNTPNYPTYTTPISATYQPHKSSPEFEEDTSKYFNNNDDVFSTNKDAAFGNDQLSDTKYTQEEYNSMGNQNNNNHQKNHFNNNAAATKRYNNYHNNNAYSRYNGEKQGMSDTRFLEGGRYFHDIYNDQKYNPTLYGDSSTEMNTNNKYWYNNRGNNNNNYAYQNYGGNNNNNNNAYQNQEEFEDEQEEFEP